MAHLSDNVDAEVEPLEGLHAEEGAGEDLLDQVPAQVQVLQGPQVLQVHVSHRLKKNSLVKTNVKKDEIFFPFIRLIFFTA